jgi:hypothetical protein
MASGHANRANRPNTWLHRPMLRREVLTCQPGAVHTWHHSDQLTSAANVRPLGWSGLDASDALLPIFDPERHSPLFRIALHQEC